MASERAIAYSEVYAILKMMNYEYLEKIPNRLQKVIMEEMDKNYQPKIIPGIPLKNQKLHAKTYTILAMLNLNYWCENQEHKEELLKKYSENEEIKNLKIREQYNPDNLFKNKDIKEEITEETVAMIEYKESILSRIINKIKRIFKRYYE